MLIQGAFTSSYSLASLSFLFIGVIGGAMAATLKAMEKRLDQLEQATNSNDAKTDS